MYYWPEKSWPTLLQLALMRSDHLIKVTCTIYYKLLEVPIYNPGDLLEKKHP